MKSLVAKIAKAHNIEEVIKEINLYDIVDFVMDSWKC